MFSLDEIKELMDKMQQTNLGELSIKDGDRFLQISAKQPTQLATPQPAISNEPTGNNDKAVPARMPEHTKAEPAAGYAMKSPIVGTFYEAAAPDKAAFAPLGSKVKKGDVLFVIESMKLMNEIQSEVDGEVIEICVTNGQTVEYNQPIMRIG